MGEVEPEPGCDAGVATTPVIGMGVDMLCECSEVEGASGEGGGKAGQSGR